MRKIRSFGFTIVELVIVIVVLGVLSTIVLVTYNNLTARALNANRASEFKNWVKMFQLYKAQFGSYPNVPKGTTTDPVTYCLGTGFPNGSDGQPRCRDYSYACDHSVNPACTSFLVSAAAPLMTELAKVGSISASNKIAVNGTVGPYVEYYQYNYMIQGWFSGNGASDCPKDSTFSWTDGNGRVACYVSVDYSN